MNKRNANLAGMSTDPYNLPDSGITPGSVREAHAKHLPSVGQAGAMMRRQCRRLCGRNAMALYRSV